MNAGDNQQYTDLSLARAHKNSDVVDMLEKAVAVEGKDVNNKTVKTYQIT